MSVLGQMSLPFFPGHWKPASLTRALPHRSVSQWPPSVPPVCPWRRCWGYFPCLCALGSSVPGLLGSSLGLPRAIPFLSSSSLQRCPLSTLSARGAWGSWTSHRDESWPGLVPVTPTRRSSHGSSRVLLEVAETPCHPLNVSFLSVAYLLLSCLSRHGWGWGSAAGPLHC